jgi:hypothetical protein
LPARCRSLAACCRFVDLGAPAALADLPAITVVAWLRPATVGGSGCFFDHGTLGNGWSADLFSVSAGDLSWTVHFDTSSAVSRRTAGGLLAVAVWSRIAITWDGSSAATGIHIYANGMEVPYVASSDATGARNTDVGNQATIGCSAGVGYAGLIDDVRIYNRALDANEVSAL